MVTLLPVTVASGPGVVITVVGVRTGARPPVMILTISTIYTAALAPIMLRPLDSSR